MKCTLIAAILIILTAFVAADLPIHCLAAQVGGTWEFELSKADKDSPDLCGYSQPDKSRHHLDGSYTYKLAVDRKVTVEMDLPSYTTRSADGNGRWTMVYDEGFSLNLGDMDFFAFHAYKAKKGFSALSNIKPENYVSLCHKTLIGWYNKGNKKFGCWRGRQIKKQHANAVISGKTVNKDEVDYAVVSPTSMLETKETLFDPDYSFIEMQNSDPEAMWTAEAHEPFLSKTVDEMLKLTGGRNYDKNFAPKHIPSPVLSQEEEDMYTSFLEQGSVIKAVDSSNDEEEEEEVTSEKNCEFGLPCQLDYRNHKGKDWVGEVRNQGSCGSCYSMALMHSLDSRIRLKYNDPNHPRLSPQDVVSCSVYNQGCDGGFPLLVAKHVQHFGAVSEKCVPYEARDGVCRNDSSCKREYPVERAFEVGGYFGGCSEEAMMRDIHEHGPLTVAFEAPRNLFSYRGGVFTGVYPRTESQGVKGVNDWVKTNHAVLIVGWGHDMVKGKRVKTWIVRNSWGSTWGENGYFRIRRGTSECGIESMATAIHIKPKAF